MEMKYILKEALIITSITVYNVQPVDPSQCKTKEKKRLSPESSGSIGINLLLRPLLVIVNRFCFCGCCRASSRSSGVCPTHLVDMLPPRPRIEILPSRDPERLLRHRPPSNSRITVYHLLYQLFCDLRLLVRESHQLL